MGKDKLEHSIKSKLSSYESSVNTDSLWAGIQAGMGASATGAAEAASSVASTSVATAAAISKGKVIIGLSLLAAVTIGSLIYFNGTKSAEMQNEKSNSEETNSSMYVNSSIAEEESLDKQTTEFPLNKMNNNASLETKEVSTSPNQQTISIDKKSTLNNTASTPTNSHIPSSSSFVQERSSTIDSEILALSQKEMEKDDVIEKRETSITSQTPSSQTMPNNSSDENISITSNSGVMSDLMTEEQMSFSLLDRLNAAGVDGPDFSFDTQLELPKKPIECPSFGGSKNSNGVFMGELQAIPYYSIPRITALSEEGELWKQRKLASESYLESFQVNLVGRYQMNNGLYFNAGIGYGQIDEKFDFEFTETFVTQEEIPVTIIISSAGDTTIIDGPGEVTQDSMYVASTYNYHRMVEFTAGLGYEIPLNGKFSIYGDVGLSINIFTSRTGFHLVDALEVDEFPSESNPIFTTSTGYKLIGGLGLRYYVGNGVVLSGGPEFRSHLSNWIREEHPIELRYLDIGMRMGVGYMF